MDSILDAITNWLREIFTTAIESNLARMFTGVNERVGTIAVNVGMTPQGWNVNIFNMIRILSETVILPIAGIIITYVLCYELITMVIDKNSLHEIDTFMFFKYMFKAGAAVLIVAHAFDITMAVFDMAQHVISRAAGVIHGNTAINIDAAIAAMNLESYGIPELLLLMIETFIISFCLNIIGVVIMVILYGRMIEIYLTCSVAPIPLATMVNKEWGQTGNNFLRGLLALGFQGFFLILCVGIYAVLVNDMIISENIHLAIFNVAAYTVLLCFAMMKSGALSKSIFGAH